MNAKVLLVLAVGLVGAATAQDDAAKAELKKLEGTWTLASGEQDGKKLSAEALKGGVLTAAGDTHTVKVGGNTYKGTHKLDPTKSPKTIDIMDTEGPFKGKTVLGVYEFTGDEFRLCFDPSGKGRPKDFTAKEGTDYRSHVWKREKK